jgi:hypothetical protein
MVTEGGAKKEIANKGTGSHLQVQVVGGLIHDDEVRIGPGPTCAYVLNGIKNTANKGLFLILLSLCACSAMCFG